MDGDFQANYQAAERAYGGGDYETAHHLASELLKQLDLESHADNNQVRDAVLGWRPFVTLLLGHIELHGLQRPDQAVGYYQLALDCQPQDTLAELAKQGLERSQNLPATTAKPSGLDHNVDKPSAGSLPSMLQDPFLHNAPPPSTPNPSQNTAMPWLTEISTPPEPRDTHGPDSIPTADKIPSNPHTSEPVGTADEDDGQSTDVVPQPTDQPPPLLIPEESLQNAWLRVSIIQNKTRADSIPMDQAKPPSILKRLLRGLHRS
ncbi:hypothetical protein OAL11_00545 [bacterium]|nr:hypothetical protein [bacterium]